MKFIKNTNLNLLRIIRFIILEQPKPFAFVYIVPSTRHVYILYPLRWIFTIAWLCCVRIKKNPGWHISSRYGRLPESVELLVKDIRAQNRYGCCGTPNPIFHTHLHIYITHTHTQCCARTEAGGSPWLQLHDNMPLEIAGLLINPADMTASPRGLAL